MSIRGEPCEVTARPARPEDVSLLAHMNRQLIVDERSRNPMSVPELEQRMRTWIEGDWRVFLVENCGQPVGYIVFQIRQDEYEPCHAEVYVRQFFVVPESRSRGIGKQAFDLIVRDHFPPAASVVLDVLEANRNARRFWESLGFQPYATTLRRTP